MCLAPPLPVVPRRPSVFRADTGFEMVGGLRIGLPSVVLNAARRAAVASAAGGLLARNFPPDAGIPPYALSQFGRRLKCGACGARWPKTELVV